MTDNLPPLPHTTRNQSSFFTEEQMKAYARAALAQAQSLPAGWPTNEMIEAGRKAAASHGPLLGNGQSLWHIFRDMLAASPQPQPVQPSDPWLPIETAPKDGMRVLLRGNDDRYADGYWQEKNVFTGPAYWVWPYVTCEPTHWAPLPPAPQPKD